MIISRLYESVKKYEDRIAIRFGEKSYTYKQFWENIVSYSRKLKNTIPPKYPVGIYMKNCPEYLFTYYGLLMEGYIPMLIDHTFTQNEVQFIQDNYHVGTIISLDEQGNIKIDVSEKEFSDFDESQFADVAACRFSSGTTGRPKCLMFTHNAILSAATNWGIASNINENDQVLCTALFHNGLAFNTSLLSVFLFGACININKRISAKAIWDILLNQPITILVAFPVVYDILSKSRYCSKNHQLRLCICSSAPLHYTIKQTFKEKTGMWICDYYGIVEGGPLTFNDGSVPESLGKPIKDVDIRIVDEKGNLLEPGQIGLLQIKSASMAKGYYNSATPFELTQDGYYQTKDRGYISDGYLYVLGREDDSINVAGKKVDPVEIENTILSLDGITDVAVVGMTNKSNTSQYPVAFYVSNVDINVQDIINHCQKHLAPFKLPQRFLKIDAIPRSGVGKIKRKELVAYLEKLEGSQC